MKSFIYFIILLSSLNLLNSVIPKWELEKIATKLTTTFPYSYVAYEDDWYEFHLILTRKIFKILKKYFPDITLFSIINATQKAYKEYKNYRTKVLEKGKEILSLAKKYKKQIILLCGRPYHIDPEINHNINKLIMSLGAFLLTEDSIPFVKCKKEKLEVLNQWTYQSRLYNAARFSLKEKNINVVQLISFGCGTDSIVSDEVKRILNAGEKIYTGIKIDENSNLGAIKIRLRSLLETVQENALN